MTKARVHFLTGIVTHYRVRFHELVRAMLSEQDIAYRLHYGPAAPSELARNDILVPSWAQPLKGFTFGQRGKLKLHFTHSVMKGSDLVIMGQENRLLHNYPMQLTPSRLRPRLAFFGHGRNFQARNPDSLAERWKRFWATKVDWWFAYTDETRRHVESLGFPPDRITVFNNAVDTSTLRAQVAAITPQRLALLRGELGLAGRHVGVFVGGLYPDKRLAFLVEAADRIRAAVPDFEMIVIGGGSELARITGLAGTRPWLHVMGPRFGQEKVELMLLGHVFLMPGLMGLAILDAAATGLPVATTAFPWHSPEIAYLEPGGNGILVSQWESASAYADAVSALLLDPMEQQRMAREARAMAGRYSIEAMARRFSAGVIEALAL